MKKIILLPIILILLSLGVFAQSHDVNTTLRINSEYKELGVLTNVTDSNITIYYPNGLTAVDNVAMIYESIGEWFYDYNIPNTEGEYSVLVNFYNNSIFKGNDTDTFNVGDVNTLKWNVCPTGTQGWVTLWIIIIILVVLAIIGIVSKNVGLIALSGIFMVFMTLITYECGTIVGLFTAFLGLTLLLISASIKT